VYPYDNSGAAKESEELVLSRHWRLYVLVSSFIFFVSGYMY